VCVIRRKNARIKRALISTIEMLAFDWHGSCYLRVQFCQRYASRSHFSTSPTCALTASLFDKYSFRILSLSFFLHMDMFSIVLDFGKRHTAMSWTPVNFGNQHRSVCDEGGRGGGQRGGIYTSASLESNASLSRYDSDALLFFWKYRTLSSIALWDMLFFLSAHLTHSPC
jgi:hypothetical protein